MNTLSRRDLLKTGALAAAALPFASLETLLAQTADPNPWRGLKIGVATYTFRDWPIEQCIAGVKRAGLQYVSIKNVKNHVDLTHTPEERKARAQMFRDAGLTPLSVGNVGMKNDEADIRRAFEYARDCGVNVMVCSPSADVTDVAQWVKYLDKVVKEFDIKLAIHNHGPENKQFPSPYDVWKAVEQFDKRIGLCIDVGHTARAGVDPAEAILKCKDRLYDLHFKDISTLSKPSPIEQGRGILNTKAILSALLKINYQGLAGFEYEKDSKDPLAGLAESAGYVRGLLNSLKPSA
ncbi:MAG: sugar phosphate isomerase/epimerase [Acidobacteria bacterium]|nr:sugar phosphate isomerase/epimerase [Acidobacteriota bacterium]MBI3425244.1 sugar phosphate isomerase/epimerase [Acidobacteriota bacterium]